MSNSRLEKFIYAICGMEVDDLPTPLSRIETLWNCLITGETPDFEPLSRNEKYLMSMLNDNVDGLPEPTSRSEKLLYKIATGETDLSDVPGYLSRYEELLKQLIENGGIGGTDFEYVLYTLNDSFSTLYSTAEAPVKSAILSGQTLVNALQEPQNFRIYGEDTISYYYRTYKTPTLKANTKYYYKVLNMPTNANWVLADSSSTTNVYFAYGSVKNTSGTITLNNNVASSSKLWIRFLNSETSTVDVLNKIQIIFLEYQDGMENWDIPYFEGMQSVKLPVLTTSNAIHGVNFETIKINLSDGSFTLNNALNSSSGSVEYFDVSNLTNAKFVFRTTQAFERENYFTFFFYDKDMNYLKWVNGQLTKVADGVYSSTIPTVENAKYLRVTKYDAEAQMGDIVRNSTSAFIDNSVSFDSTFSIKTNILTVNEPVELRGIGNVRDELDLLTGELTQRIGEIVLDGSMIDITIFRKNGSSFLMIRFDKIGFKKINDTINIISSKLRNVKYYSSESFNTGDVMSDAVGWGFGICFATNETATRDEAIAYLNNLKPVIQGYLETPVIKTVGLSTLDQDGQPTKLSTFNDITHVSIEAEDLLPTVDLEVPTKIEETLSTLPTQMIDISEKQHSLNEKIDEQAKNIKEVSTAMIEIRNDIL